MGERVAIVGNRDLPWMEWSQVHDLVDSLPQDAVVVTGDARGADWVAYKQAGTRGLARVRHVAHWDELGKAAGPERNARVVADCDRLVAFWDGLSRGTKNAIDQARRAGKPVEIRRWKRAEG